MPAIASHKFRLGRCVATPGALEAIADAGQTPSFFIDRHVAGDWGQVCPEDALENERSVALGYRILSVYKTLRGVKLWIITEAEGDDGNRAATTILLPEEY